MTRAGQIGQRVKLLAPSPLVTLRSPYGVVVRECEYGGYVVVKLDEPAIGHCWGDEELTEIVEHPDNCEAVS